MRVRNGAIPTSDRERRAALEVLQAELRQVRAAIAQERASSGTPPAVEALRDAVARALARRDEARQRHAELERERADFENERRWLEREAQEEKIRIRSANTALENSRLGGCLASGVAQRRWGMASRLPRAT
jgi:chromosome segregation ATPase